MATYVCSDIHGLKDRYDQMMTHVTAKDTLYILGDVIDRGNDGIAILQDIMKRDNVVMLMGNHEYMMIQYYQAISHTLPEGVDEEVVKHIWQRNHCAPTIRAFERLTTQEQKDILNFLTSLPVVICDCHVQDKWFYLVHGSPVTSLTTGTYRLQELKALQYPIESFLWDRVYTETQFFEDRCVIIGHTPTMLYSNSKPYEIWTAGKEITQASLIDIDCGCAANDEYTQLAMLDLESYRIQYF